MQLTKRLFFHFSGDSSHASLILFVFLVVAVNCRSPRFCGIARLSPLAYADLITWCISCLPCSPFPWTGASQPGLTIMRPSRSHCQPLPIKSSYEIWLSARASIGPSANLPGAKIPFILPLGSHQHFWHSKWILFRDSFHSTLKLTVLGGFCFQVYLFLHLSFPSVCLHRRPPTLHQQPPF